ncbi:hypothetical protein KIPE111705_27170 [Kibdelosporangium persicum]|uniref:Glycosyl hydrolases family 32 N-terminal domain-containing protein n=1 Tax=Kibdelosporangium persicum TaxID=2698649 RepID=A0ABX2EWC9_9PSEU|nr:hypothetical protein [Kibdelosporangium persicum]NRN63279.1 Glycosyl hydrolases family 32 N-terminal domain-containing protein [Kibdelosporangium persicum]
MTVSRRQLLAGTAAVTLGLPVGGPTVTATAAPAGFPDYQYLRLALVKSKLRYNPTNELIFPCIRGTAGRIPNARGAYYLYYAPHDTPGGICLAYANSLDEEFTEYPGNPIISRNWPGEYSVSHVSSPHALWNADARRMYLYFHGENTVTRLASSADGIHFRYEKEVLSTRLVPGSTETSYARVFRYDLPSHNARYIMVFMINTSANHRDIGWGWSPDALNWTFAQTPLIRHSDVNATDISGPHLLFRNGSAYVVYHTDIASGGNILITELGAGFTKRNHFGVFHDSLPGAPDNGRSAAPSFGTYNGREYMIYEAGSRLSGNIAIARAV